MITLKDYKINKEVFKNSYTNDINTLKKLLKLKSNMTINDISKLSCAKKGNKCFKININEKINYKNIDFEYFFILNENNEYILNTIEIESKNEISIKKYYSINKDLLQISITKLYSYLNDISSVSYIKSYYIQKSLLTIIHYNNKKDNIVYYDDMHIYYKSKKFYFVNNELYFTFPTSTKKYKNIVNLINLSNNLIDLKRFKIYTLFLYLNKKLNINECRELMNLINSKILMFYLIKE